MTEVKFHAVEGNERLAKTRVANIQAEPEQDSHCIHMLSVLEKKLFFFCGYHLIQCHSHRTEVIIYFGTQANKRINVKTKYFKRSWY